jgi:hypothetical protein
MPPSKRLTIHAIYRAGYSKLENIFKDPKIAFWGTWPDTSDVAVNQKNKE